MYSKQKLGERRLKDHPENHVEYMESRRPGIFSAQSVITRSRQRQGFVVMVSVLSDLDSVVELCLDV